VALTERKMYTGFLWGKLKETQLDRPSRRREDNIKMDFKEKNGGTSTGLILFRLVTSVGLL
jgi:hypothetical protein